MFTVKLAKPYPSLFAHRYPAMHDKRETQSVACALQYKIMGQSVTNIRRSKIDREKPAKRP